MCSLFQKKNLSLISSAIFLPISFSSSPFILKFSSSNPQISFSSSFFFLTVSTFHFSLQSRSHWEGKTPKKRIQVNRRKTEGEFPIRSEIKIPQDLSCHVHPLPPFPPLPPLSQLMLNFGMLSTSYFFGVQFLFLIFGVPVQKNVCVRVSEWVCEPWP